MKFASQERQRGEMEKDPIYVHPLTFLANF